MFFIDKALTPITMVIVGIYSLSQMGADVVPAAIKEAVRLSIVMCKDAPPLFWWSFDWKEEFHESYIGMGNRSKSLCQP